MEEISKFDLTSSEPIQKKDAAPARPSMIKSKLSAHKKKIFISLGIILVVFVIAGISIIIPALKTIASAKTTYAQLKKTVEAVKKQNIEVASIELAKTKKDLAATQKDLKALSYLKFIPLLNNYYNDAEHLAAAGEHGLNAATLLVDSVKPYADVLGLKGQGSFVMGSAEQRIQTAVMTMGKITPRIDDIAKELVLVEKEIDQVDPNHYPPFLGGEKIRANLIALKNATGEGVVFVNEAKPLIKVLPTLLGENSEKKYLVLFQNDKELRPTGGFITAYAIFRIEKGVIKVDKSQDIYSLDNAVPNKQKAPEPILKYLPKVPTFNLRDSNLSPDYVKSMQTFNQMYDTIRGKTKIDGIIAVDTHVLVSIIKVLDDEVSAGGITFTSKLEKICNCPQAIYALEDNISRPVNYIKEERKGLLGDLLYAIMQKALKSSPKLYWGPLIQTMINETAQKHVLFYLFDKDAQSGIEALNAAGKITAPEGDYLHINDTNFSGAKTNLFVQQTVNQDYAIASDGTITKTLTIKFKNPFPPSDCNLERGGLCLNALHRDWIRIYVPKGSKLISSQGSQVKVTTGEELGKTVFEGFVTVKPEGFASYTLKYSLPFKLANGESLPLSIQKQPGTDANEYTISVNGRQVSKFPLLTDKQVKVNK